MVETSKHKIHEYKDSLEVILKNIPTNVVVDRVKEWKKDRRKIEER